VDAAADRERLAMFHAAVDAEGAGLLAEYRQACEVFKAELYAEHAPWTPSGRQ
jgi:hypothetical protein